jgi:nuclease HARBI1
MSALRISAEWAFLLSTETFMQLRHTKQFPMVTSKVPRVWEVGTFLRNVITCARRNNRVSEYFSMQPPTLVDYLASQ